MDENPYQSPASLSPPVDDDDAPAIGVRSGRRKDVRRIVRLQQAMITIAMAYVVLFGVLYLIERFDHLLPNLPAPWMTIMLGAGLTLTVLFIVVLFCGIVVTVLLTARFWPIYVAGPLGLIAAFPCVGLAPMLLANFQARRVLRANGIPLGRFWARWPVD